MGSLFVHGARTTRALAVLGLVIALLCTGCRCCDERCGRLDEPRLPAEPSVLLLGPAQERLASAILRTAWSYRRFGERSDAPSEIATDTEGRVASSVMHRLADTDAWLLPAASDTGPRFAPVRLREALALSTQQIQFASVGEFKGLLRGGPQGDRQVRFSSYSGLVGADGRLHKDKHVVIVGDDDSFRGPTFADRRVPVSARIDLVFSSPASEPLTLGWISGPIPPGCEVKIHLDGPVIDRTTISARRPNGTPLALDLMSIHHTRARPLYSLDGSELPGTTLQTDDPIVTAGGPVERVVVRNVSMRRPYLLSGFVSDDMKWVGVDSTTFRAKAERFDLVVEFQGSELEVVVPETTR